MSEDTAMPVSKAKIGGVIVALITWVIGLVNYKDMDSPLIVIIISLASLFGRRHTGVEDSGGGKGALAT